MVVMNSNEAAFQSIEFLKYKNNVDELKIQHFISGMCHIKRSL